MVRAACAVHFASSDAGKTHVRPLLAPDRTVAIPNGDRRTLKCLPCWHYGRCQKRCKNHSIASLMPRCGAIATSPNLAMISLSGRRTKALLYDRR